MSPRRSRLSAQHPIVAAALADVPPDRLAEAVGGVATDAARTCGVLDLCVGAADLEQLVTDLEDAAGKAKRADEGGGEPGASYEQLFRRARAADAWRQAAAASNSGAASDAVYEALHALGADAAAEAHVVELLNT